MSFANRDAAYTLALRELDEMSQDYAKVIFGEYEEAIETAAYLFRVGADEIVCDLNEYRAGRRSQGVAA